MGWVDDLKPHFSNHEGCRPTILVNLCMAIGTGTCSSLGRAAKSTCSFLGGLYTSGSCCGLGIVDRLRRACCMRLMSMNKNVKGSRNYWYHRLQQYCFISPQNKATAFRAACNNKPLARQQAGSLPSLSNAQCTPEVWRGCLLTWGLCRRYAFAAEVAKRSEKADFYFKPHSCCSNFQLCGPSTPRSGIPAYWRERSDPLP